MHGLYVVFYFNFLPFTKPATITNHGWWVEGDNVALGQKIWERHKNIMAAVIVFPNLFPVIIYLLIYWNTKIISRDCLFFLLLIIVQGKYYVSLLYLSYVFPLPIYFLLIWFMCDKSYVVWTVSHGYHVWNRIIFSLQKKLTRKFFATRYDDIYHTFTKKKDLILFYHCHHQISV